MRNFVLTSSSVTDGHPDKLCDCISDAIVDAYLSRDTAAQISAECAIASGIAFVAVHAATQTHIDFPEIVKGVVEEAGYDDRDFNAQQALTVMSSVMPMPAKDRAGGFIGDREVATVNTTVFGYASQETEEMLPLSIVLAHRLARRIKQQRQTGELSWLHPDAQAQVAVRYRGRKAVSVDGVTLLVVPGLGETKHDLNIQELRERIIEPVLSEIDVESSKDASIWIEAWETGGLTRHAGLTGRKTDIDTFGGYCRHGAAALSGKDPSRIDRTGAYAARYAAKNIVAAGLAEECEIQLSYMLGRPAPAGLGLETFGTGVIPDEDLARVLCDVIDFDVTALATRFGLNRLPMARAGHFFGPLGAFGHFGRADLELPWEATDTAGDLKGAAMVR